MRSLCPGERDSYARRPSLSRGKCDVRRHSFDFLLNHSFLLVERSFPRRV